MKTDTPSGQTDDQRGAASLALTAGSAFGWNPAHAIGTCAKCGAEMRYNVPRLGPDGGYVHAANGGLDCFANDLTIKIEHYFATVTPEQLDADLKAAHFDEYNKIGADILPPNNKVTNAPTSAL